MAKANAQFFGVTNGVPNVPADKYYETLRGFIIGQLRVQKKERGIKEKNTIKLWQTNKKDMCTS